MPDVVDKGCGICSAAWLVYARDGFWMHADLAAGACCCCTPAVQESSVRLVGHVWTCDQIT